jgi:hypothetical protein
MLKAKTTEQNELPLDVFTEFNKAIFYDDQITPDVYTPLTDAPA